MRQISASLAENHQIGYDPVMEKICGIDEAGRGPIAGPVTAGAVILPDDFPVEILDDSKKLSPKKRLEAVKRIMQHAEAWGIGWAWPEEIDTINIHHATLLAMKRAFEDMGALPDIVLVDGIHLPELPCQARAEVKGDTRFHAIQAASILAKTVRDRWMERYSWIEPRYGFEKHKGYPTIEHRRLVGQYGLSPIHRKSFQITF